MEENKFPKTAEEAYEIFKDYQYPNCSKIEKDITDYKNKNSPKPYEDIINEIVLWKDNRQTDVDEKWIKKIANLGCTREEIREEIEEGKAGELREILEGLLNSFGVNLAMASTILKMFHPDVFPIIDKRAYHALRIHEGSKGKEAVLKVYSNSTAIEKYMMYIIDCYDYYDKVLKDKVWEGKEVKFSVVDQILYQWDKNEGYDLEGIKKEKKKK